MAVYSFEERTPRMGKDCFVAETAAVVGDVVIGEGVYVGPGAVVRGDYGSIVIGDRTSVEENVVVHARPGERTTIGSDVTLGHGCIIHNCIIKDFAVIGMGSVVSDYATVGDWGVVAEGAVVRNGSVVEPGMIVAGVPAKPLKSVDEEFKSTWRHFKSIYPDLARRYPSGLKRLDV